MLVTVTEYLKGILLEFYCFRFDQKSHHVLSATIQVRWGSSSSNREATEITLNLELT